MKRLIRRGEVQSIQPVYFPNEDGSEMLLFRFPMLDDTGIVRHCFAGRQGGVSSGIHESMNLSFTRGDDPVNVWENFRRAARYFDGTEENFVLTYQIHGTKVRRVGREDMGKGVILPRDWDDTDGLVTDAPGVILGTFFADCVPLMFVDPVHRAIGSSHSGWRGTVGRMGQATLEKMREEFGTRPEDVLCGIGPSICQENYEISEDVAQKFRTEFAGHEEEILIDKHNGHSQLDLWKANEIVLREAGVRKEHIAVTDLCTYDNHDVLFSHRYTQGKHGNFAGFLMLL